MKTKTYEEQVEELEKGCEKDLKRKAFDGNINLYCGIEIFVGFDIGMKIIFCEKCKIKAKKLKEEIEKERNIFDERLNNGCYDSKDIVDYDNCQNLIQRLNKIIGDEE